MKKIKTLFVLDRTMDTPLATNVINNGAEWVLNGEGFATLKRDGTSCFIKDGVLYKRWNRKISKKNLKMINKAKANGKDIEITLDLFNPLPDGAISCNESFDPITYHFPHWIPVLENDNSNKEHLAAFADLKANNMVVDGTYELCSPKVRSNPYNLDKPVLFKHGSEIVEVKDRSFEGFKSLFKNFNGEGVVFHNENGEMFKVRVSDMYLFKNVPSNRREEWFLDEIETDPNKYKHIPEHYEFMLNL